MNEWLPYGKHWVSEDEIHAVTSVLRSNWLTTGPSVAAFENALAQIAGAPCVSVTSGTAALRTAYAAAGVTQDTEVITTPMTFIATASAAALAGAKVHFVDITDDTANIDPEHVAAAITSRTRAVTGVDYAGHPFDIDAVRSACRGTDAVLIQDAAHSLGASYKGKPVGSLADLTTFSFFPTKHATTAEGGAVSALSDSLHERAQRFARIGRVDVSHSAAQPLRYPDEGAWWYEMSEFGENFRLPDVLAALGVQQLARLESFVARRAEIVDYYNAAFADLDGVRTPTTRDNVTPAWHLYPLRVLDGRRREVFEKLRAQNIGVQVNYIPVYWHPVFEDLGYQRGMCPVAEQFYAEELSLPLFPAMSESDQERVVEAVRSAVRG